MNKEEKIERNAILSCLLEVAADKPGNISRFYNFESTTYEQYIASSLTIANAIRKLVNEKISVGKAIYNAVKDSIEIQEGGNTNLGIILILMPLVKSAKGKNLRNSLKNVLEKMDYKDTVYIYKAIRLAKPSLLKVKKLDIKDKKTLIKIKKEKIGTIDFMRSGKKFNNICYEYSTNYKMTFEIGLPCLINTRKKVNINSAILHCFIVLLSKKLDYLIIAKHGLEKAKEVQRKAKEILKLGSIFSEKGRIEIKKFTKKLRNEKINPGSTADLITASLFTALMRGMKV